MAIPTGKLVVESNDPRINYNLLPGETLLTCPYNYYHAVLPIKFNKHVLKLQPTSLQGSGQRWTGTVVWNLSV
ncbi:hypothetical protein Ocin01_18636 [Orchesella cincta]|uniref:Uncharacterized protein n=1 Tax=Orchesella cincta TaxID=48709 RepID=A0A1D2M4Z9_ORCCI|nr:hypothetical protein Ocin01_18636 [Orchesella cincta]